MATKADNARIAPLAWLMVMAELALVLGAAYALDIEARHNLPLLLPVIFVGVAINAWLPPVHRLHFFLGLSLTGILIVMGPEHGLALIATGLGLIGICHLPHPWSTLGLVAAGVALAAVGANLVPASWTQEFGAAVLPLLGAMFMFRVILYLYDLRSDPRPVPLVQRIGYFFMLPNVCFPLFPVVDFRTWLREHYSAPSLEVYQKGLNWIMRGIVHLLVYRLVYHHWTPSFEEVQDLAGVLQYVVSSYLLYLRVSGMFHVAVGILCLFGFNLPETHRLYFLASTFTDFWRRINIYWKDFVMKVLYYPIFMRIKGGGVPRAVMIASLVSLILSWLLHSYQTFWLQGVFPLTIQDAVFWTFLGVAVSINAMLELKGGRARAQANRERTLRPALVLSLKTVAMFCFMSLLWSFWSTSSVVEWFAVIKVATRASAGEIALLLAGLAALVMFGTAVQLVTQRGWVLSSEKQMPARRAALVTALVATIAIGLSRERVGEALDGEALNLWATTMRPASANSREQEQEARGYYEELLGADGGPKGGWTLQSGSLVTRYFAMVGVAGLADAVQGTSDVRRYELRPSIEVMYKGAPFSTNRWGMRDRDYEQVAPPGTCRIMLFGDSHTMGSGVANDATFESLLEDRLNRERPLQGCERHEILNFGIAGYSALQAAIHARHYIPRFEPDLVMYASAQPELRWAGQRLALALAEGAEIEDPFLVDLVARAGIERGMNEYEMRQRLVPLQSELVGWSYRLMAEVAKDSGAPVVWIFLPRLGRDPARVVEDLGRLEALARDAGFYTMSVANAYDGHESTALQTAPWDKHPNSKANALIAEHLYAGLLGRLQRIQGQSDATSAGD